MSGNRELWSHSDPFFNVLHCDVQTYTWGDVKTMLSLHSMSRLEHRLLRLGKKGQPLKSLKSIFTARNTQERGGPAAMAIQVIEATRERWEEGSGRKRLRTVSHYTLRSAQREGPQEQCFCADMMARRHRPSCAWHHSRRFICAHSISPQLLNDACSHDPPRGPKTRRAATGQRHAQRARPAGGTRIEGRQPGSRACTYNSIIQTTLPP